MAAEGETVTPGGVILSPLIGKVNKTDRCVKPKRSLSVPNEKNPDHEAGCDTRRKGFPAPINRCIDGLQRYSEGKKARNVPFPTSGRKYVKSTCTIRSGAP